MRDYYSPEHTEGADPDDGFGPESDSAATEVSPGVKPPMDAVQRHASKLMDADVLSLLDAAMFPVPNASVVQYWQGHAGHMAALFDKLTEADLMRWTRAGLERPPTTWSYQAASRAVDFHRARAQSLTTLGHELVSALSAASQGKPIPVAVRQELADRLALLSNDRVPPPVEEEDHEDGHS